jgi:hypothetical protein
LIRLLKPLVRLRHCRTPVSHNSFCFADDDALNLPLSV